MLIAGQTAAVGSPVLPKVTEDLLGHKVEALLYLKKKTRVFNDFNECKCLIYLELQVQTKHSVLANRAK